MACASITSCNEGVYIQMNDSFQVLCATMHQKDFSKIKEMNISSDILYANQSDSTWYVKTCIDKYSAEMITTHTRGLANNRNILLMYATADICLLADDDVTYYEGYKDKIMSAFGRHPEADMIIFNLDSNSSDRKIEKIPVERKMRFWNKNPYGSVRVAFRLKSQKKYNIWFNNLLGTGARYGSGEDTLFINEFRKKGNVYLCCENLGKVDFSHSTWFFGYDETYFFNQGAKVFALGKRPKWIWFVYYALKISRNNINFRKRIQLLQKGYKSYFKL